jgi:hypothetical protein
MNAGTLLTEASLYGLYQGFAPGESKKTPIVEATCTLR